MGVPAFYRWLSEKYPKIVQDILEERVKVSSGSTRIPFNWSLPNPSGLECDNLYIDMNGIIHPCSHPEHGPQPTSEEEMFENVCRYVDRLVHVMRPRQMLYLAIDGVAPRAKMNQQRSRRFRSAQEARETLELEENIRQELIQNGQKIPPLKKSWDSNVITPGTKFMLRLSEFLRFYVRKRLTESKSWRHLRIIFSDASIPGEGEHKIMSHIRLQRNQPGYDPNLVHVLHGLDADLIMLALATHETHFYISRELVTFGRRSQEQLEQRQLENGFRDQQRKFDEEAGEEGMDLLENKGTPLQRVSIPILREYLANEFAELLVPGKLPFGANLENLLDDFVFLCFFVGNDFLPHLPSLDIRDGALDYLLNVYKRVLPGLGGYITSHGGNVNLSNVDVILAEVGSIEDHVFTMKHDNESRDKQRKEQMRERKKLGRNKMEDPRYATQGPTHNVQGRAAKILAEKEKAKEATKLKPSTSSDNSKAAEELKKSLLGGKPSAGNGTTAGEAKSNKASPTVGDKRTRDDTEDGVNNGKEDSDDDPDEGETEMDPSESVKEKAQQEEAQMSNDPSVAAAFKDKMKSRKQKQLDEYSDNVVDKVRLHESGWKDRYYSDKCKADDVSNHGGREHLFRSYVVGLTWVMKYYYDGCCSWKWYYPFHYAPFASDLRNIERFQKDVKALEHNEPFKPVEQLMAVLPSDSSHAIPKSSRWLMMDPESPILDFYPKEVPVDPNGKAMPWLWVVLLPFIEEDRLFEALHPSQEKWTLEESLCNARGLDDGYLYIHKSHGLVNKVKSVFDDLDKYKLSKIRISGAPAVGVKGFTGSVRLPLSNEVIDLDDNKKVDLPARASAISRASHDNLFSEAIDSSDVVCVSFNEPPKLSHKSVLLPGARPLPPSLKREDRVIRRPRLNRGGGTIANLGTGQDNGQSFRSGYGSMNISQQERDLAARTGRGHQMYQAGTRAWGAAEPTPKRPRVHQGGHHHQQQSYGQQPVQQYHSNPFNRPPPPPPPPPPRYQQQQHRQQPPNQARQHQNQGQHHQHGQRQHYQQQQQQYPGQNHHHHNQNGGQQPRGRNQPYSGQNNNRPYSGNRPYTGQQQQQHQGQQQRQGHNFQSLNRSPPPGQQQQQRQPARVNPSVISDLRSQLASTLKQHRQGRK